MKGEATSLSPDDRKVQIVEQAREPERDREATLVRYDTALLWLGTVGLIGIGGLLLIAAPAVGASFVACGGLSLVGLIRVKRIGDRALVLDDEGMSYTTIWGTRYHVPWSEITGARVGSKGVVLQLRAPRGQFKVPPRIPGRERVRGGLFLPETLDISSKDLVGLIQARLAPAEDGDA